MNITIIRDLTRNYKGGIKQLAADIGMSEANMHRCLNNNSIQAEYLENIAKKLGVDIRVFFDMPALKSESQNQSEQSIVLLELCKALISNYKQRDEVMAKLITLVNKME